MWPDIAWSVTRISVSGKYQIERGGTWDKGKGCDTFGPVGPWLVTGEIDDPQNLELWLEVNGRYGLRRETRAP